MNEFYNMTIKQILLSLIKDIAFCIVESIRAILQRTPPLIKKLWGMNGISLVMVFYSISRGSNIDMGDLTALGTQLTLHGTKAVMDIKEMKHKAVEKKALD